jgi:hypothetical protein
MCLSPKKINIYEIEDEKVVFARRMLGHSLKYLLETNNRKKDNTARNSQAYLYYNAYINAFNAINPCIHGFGDLKSPPSDFIYAMQEQTLHKICIDSIVREFLFCVAMYMEKETKKHIEVSFLTFYFDNSIEKVFGSQCTKNNFDTFVSEVLRGQREFTQEELDNLTIMESSDIERVLILEEV